MTPEETQAKEARLDAIRARIAGIAAMLDGALLAKRNRTRRKDGSVHVSPEHYTFQYRGADGRRKWRRVPKAAKPAVERLVRAGERYRALEREYAALLTEISLEGGSKKNG
jgi:hypothetical protein